MALTVSVLRELFRHFQAFRALYETEGIDTIVGPDGAEFSLWDVQYLINQVRYLPPRQCEAIQLFLIENMKESDAAVKMGVSETNPVAKYAAEGLSKIVALVEAGDLPRFREGFMREVAV